MLAIAATQDEAELRKLVKIFVSPSRRRTMYTNIAVIHLNAAGHPGSSLAIGNLFSPETQNYLLRAVVDEDIWFGEYTPTVSLASFSKNPQEPHQETQGTLNSRARRRNSRTAKLWLFYVLLGRYGGLLPGDYLKEAPERTYFRIISGAMLLLKTFS
jgi:hypothetical protein